MSRSTHQCPDVRNYALAHKVFTETKPVKSSAWASNVRPLHPKRGSYSQYRIVQHEGGKYYDIMLYEIIMGRHYAQDQDGSYTTYYNNYNTSLSRDFLYNVLSRNWANQITDTTGKQVVAHIGYANTKHFCVDPTDNERFAAKWVLVQSTTNPTDPNKWRLDTARSHEAKCYAKVSTDEDVQRRAAVRGRVETLVTMAALRLPQMAQNAAPSRWRGEPFSQQQSRFHFQNMRGICDPDVLLDDALTPTAMATFFEAAQSVYDTLLSKRAYAASRGDWVTFEVALNKINNTIDEKDFTTAFMRFLITRSGNDTQRGRRYLPQWSAPGEWPKTGVFAE